MKDVSIKPDASAALFCSAVSCSKLISSIMDTAVRSLSAEHTDSKKKKNHLYKQSHNYTSVAVWLL